MKYAYTTDAIRAAEHEVMAVVGDDALMQIAARGLAVACAQRLRRHRDKLTGARVLVIVGPGNNGGDGLFAAAWLARRGVSVSLWQITDQVHPAGWRAALAAGVRTLPGSPTTGFDMIIDAGFGIGGRDGIDGPLARFADACRGVCDVVAVDLPSGLGVETVRPTKPVFEADATVTFGAWKPSLLLTPARASAGEVSFVDIGLHPHDPVVAQWEDRDVAAVWPFPTSRSDKYARGVVGLDAGSPDYPGAGLLAVGGAVYAGAGMVRFLGPDLVRGEVIAQFPSVVHGDGRCQSYLCGPGWGSADHLRDRLAGRLASGRAMVIDADALMLLPARLHRENLLTPHAGELARLLNIDRASVEHDPLAAVRTAADRTGATVLLKGATQYVATPGERCVHVAVQGPGWTGQAGSGDTLAGICAALLAAGLDARTAALAGASVQAITARNHPGPHPPNEIARRLPDTIAKLEQLAQENH